MAGIVSKEQSHSPSSATFSLCIEEGLERAAKARELTVGGDPRGYVGKKESQPRVQSEICSHDETTANQLWFEKVFSYKSKKKPKNH